MNFLNKPNMNMNIAKLPQQTLTGFVCKNNNTGSIIDLP